VRQGVREPMWGFAFGILVVLGVTTYAVTTPLVLAAAAAVAVWGSAMAARGRTTEAVGAEGPAVTFLMCAAVMTVVAVLREVAPGSARA